MKPTVCNNQECIEDTCHWIQTVHWTPEQCYAIPLEIPLNHVTYKIVYRKIRRELGAISCGWHVYENIEFSLLSISDYVEWFRVLLKNWLFFPVIEVIQILTPRYEVWRWFWQLEGRYVSTWGRVSDQGKLDSSVRLRIFWAFLSKSLEWFYTATYLFTGHFLDQGTFYFLRKKNSINDSCHALTFLILCWI